MQPFQKRMAILQRILNDEDKVLEPIEAVATIYCAIRFELAVAKKNRAERKMQKYGTRINQNIDVLNLRREMNEKL